MSCLKINHTAQRSGTRERNIISSPPDSTPEGATLKYFFVILGIIYMIIVFSWTTVLHLYINLKDIFTVYSILPLRHITYYLNMASFYWQFWRGQASSECPQFRCPWSSLTINVGCVSFLGLLWCQAVLFSVHSIKELMILVCLTSDEGY